MDFGGAWVPKHALSVGSSTSGRCLHPQLDVVGAQPHEFVEHLGRADHIAALPPVLIALAFQRYLVAGLVSGAVKG